ncbi:MAG: DUF4127 family protein [Candidatus Sericytochromatia bacterium]|nr:DUF4127 family protein [Candidatus Sericytochromatia bacterium]
MGFVPGTLTVMTDRILLIPLDDRTCTSRLPVHLGAVAGRTVLTPPLGWIGNLTRRAEREALGAWLIQAAHDAEAVVLALDTLAYGGLVGSRQSREPPQAVTERLLCLWALREANPTVRIAGFITIPRLSATAAPEEEAPYWPQYGEAIARYSRLVHASRLAGSAEATDLMHHAQAAIPAEILADYLAGRQRNLAINRQMIEWAAAGLFDLLYLTVDDSADLGLNVLERDELALLVADRQLGDRVLIYPGADEVACSLLSRVLLEKAAFQPAFFPVYAHEYGPQAVTMYEGLPLQETVRLHMAAAGVRLAPKPETADCQLFIHGPEKTGGDFWLDLDLPEDRRDVPEWFVQGIATALQMGSPVAIADVAWANAAHPAFVQRLFDTCPVRNLLAFAGWNTAGNTLGTVFAHAALRLLALEQGGDLAAQERAQQIALFERFAEDWLYMAVERPAAASRPGPPDFETLSRQMAVRSESCYLRHWQGNVVTRVDAGGIPHYWRLGAFRRTLPTFPWARLFDVDLAADFDLEAT